MELAGVEVPVPIIVLLAVVLVVDVALLIDLSRRDVKQLPKWAWAIVILVVSFPLGAILYVVVGRVPRGETGAAPRVDAGPGPESRWVDGLGPPPPPPPPPPPGAAATRPAAEDELVVDIRGLRKEYGTTVALADVDLAVPRGATYGLIGPNGAGKTTLLSILAGLRRPTAGTVELGIPRRRMGVLVDTPQFEPWLTAREVVDLARHLTAPQLDHQHVEAVLAEVGLADAIDRRVGGFSRGMLQRLGLAACLVGDPEVLLLDEPSSALDPAGRREVLDLIGRLAHDRTVILSTHILSDVQQVADLVAVIADGQVRFQGPVADLLARTSTTYALHVRPPSPALVAALVAQPWAGSVAEQAPGRIRLVVGDAAAAGRGVPRLVAEHELEMVAFTPATDLETAFLELVGP